jgi:hypothetical protein
LARVLACPERRDGVRQTAERLGLQSTSRPRGRPKKGNRTKSPRRRRSATCHSERSEESPCSRQLRCWRWSTTDGRCRRARCLKNYRGICAGRVLRPRKPGRRPRLPKHPNGGIMPREFTVFLRPRRLQDCRFWYHRGSIDGRLGDPFDRILRQRAAPCYVKHANHRNRFGRRPFSTPKRGAGCSLFGVG